MRRLGLIGAVLLLGAAPPPHERMVTGDGVVAAEVNGAPARIRIDPGALAMPIISADLAERAKLHGGSRLLGKGFGLGYAFHIGPTLVTGPTAVGKLTLGDAPFARRIAWNERRYQPDVDGVIGPGGVPEPVVAFQLHPALPGERTVALPLVGDGGLLDGWGPSLAQVQMAGMTIRVRFAPRTPRSYLPAGTALRLADVLGGRLQGAGEEVPIMFGVARPVRTMVLARPLVVGPLSLGQVGVRIAEGVDLRAIPESDTPPAGTDPDEVVVVARDKHKRRPGTLTLGADALARCSSLVFDKPAKQVRLTCG